MKFKSKSLIKSCLTVMIALSFVIIAGVTAQAAGPAKVTNIKVLDANTTTADVTWNSIAGAEYEISVSNTKTGTYVLKGTSINNTYRIAGLGVGKTSYIKVRAYVRENGEKVYGEYSDPYAVDTALSAKPAKFKFVSHGDNNVKLQWNKVKGASSYIVYYRVSGTNDKYKTARATGNSINIKKLKKNTFYTFYVGAIRKGVNYSIISPNVSMVSWIPTRPTKITGLKHYMTDRITNKYIFTAKQINTLNGINYQIYNSSKKKVVDSNFKALNGFSFKSGKVKNNQFYRMRARGYVTINKSKKYGAWSDYIWFASDPKCNRQRRINNGFNLEWEKTSGATNYSVFISTKSQSGYKKAGTTKNTNFNITKYGKNKLVQGKTYYVYVEANKKVSGKTYKSKSSACYPIYY